MDTAAIGLIDIILFIIFILVIVWIVSRKKKGADKPPPVIYIIQASDALEHTGRLREILQNLKSENRISRFTYFSADEALSTLPADLKKGDMILIVLTNQLEDHKNQIENRFSFLKNKLNEARAAEILVDNVVYDKAFITLPTDLVPIRNRKDMDDAWSSILESLKTMFPKMQGQAREKQPDNDRLKAVESQQNYDRLNSSENQQDNDRLKAIGKQPGNDRLKEVKKHPDYPELLKHNAGSAYLYGRYMFQIIFGLIFTAISIFFISSPPDSDSLFDLVWLFGSLIFTVVGIGITGYGIYRIIKLISSNTYKLPALIVDKRISVSGGSQSSSSIATYYVTLELDDLGRRELKVRGKLYGKITNEDVGVAYIHDRYLLDYRRLGL